MATAGIGQPTRQGLICLYGAVVVLLAVVFSTAVCAGVAEAGYVAGTVSSHAHATHAPAHGHRLRDNAFGQPVAHCRSVLSDLADARAVPPTPESGDPDPTVAVLALPRADVGSAAGIVRPGGAGSFTWRPPPLILTTARLRL